MSQQNFDPNQYGQQPAQGMPQPVLGQAPDAQGKATFAHISILLTWIATLIMWSIYKDKPGYEVVKRAAARAFNVSITISIAAFVGLIIPIILTVVAVAGDNRGLAVVALILMVVVAIVVGIWGIAAFVCHIIGAVKANAGETDYKYPLPALKILKD